MELSTIDQAERDGTEGDVSVALVEVVDAEDRVSERGEPRTPHSFAANLFPYIERAARALGSIETAADYACDKLAHLEAGKRMRLKNVATMLMMASVNAGSGSRSRASVAG